MRERADPLHEIPMSRSIRRSEDGWYPTTGATAVSAQPPSPSLTADVFSAFPYGIVVVDRSGAIIAHNAAAASVLGDLAGPDGVPRTSCELLGCHRPGPLEKVCLTELAAERGGALPEIRLDLPPGEHARAAWVTAAPLDGDAGHIVIELRPGDARDRRRRTTPHWTAGAELRIYTLGRTRVESSEGSIGGRWLEQRPGQLLKYLLAERHRVVRREEIAETIWPGADLRILGSVRHFVHALRARLEPDRPTRKPSSFVLNTQGGYMIDRRHVYVDADDFEDQVRAGLAHLEAGRTALARERLEQALQLYRGDFLADEPYAEWALDERAHLRDLAARVLHTLARIDEQANDLEAAYLHLRRLAELEPLDIHVQRDLLAVCLRRGRRTEARRRYDALWRRSMRELGHEPGFLLTDLADEVGGADAAGPDTAPSADRPVS
jgi:DNA-binding SARP family transcriptional activator